MGILLKLRLELGESLDRHLDAASRHLSKLLEKSVSSGYLRIWSYPRFDSVLAASVLYSVSASLGTRPVFKTSITPPSRIEIPTILLGYQQVDYGTSQVEAPLFAVARRILSSPPPDAVFLDGDGSVPGMVALLLLSMGGIFTRRELLALLLSAMYKGDNIDPRGRFYGVDAVAVDRMLPTDRLGLDSITTLKAYLPHELTICESISITVNPYYPTFTGNKEECDRFLQASGLGRISDKTLETISKKDLENLAVSLLSRIKEYSSLTELDASYYLGAILVSRNTTGHIKDYRLASDALLYASEAFRSPAPLLASSLDYENEYRIIEQMLLSYSKEFPEQVSEAMPKRIKKITWARTYLVTLARPTSLTLLWMALSILKKIDRESILVLESDGEYIASSYQIEYALGEGSLKRLKDAKVLEGDGVLVKINTERQ